MSENATATAPKVQATAQPSSAPKAPLSVDALVDAAFANAPEEDLPVDDAGLDDDEAPEAAEEPGEELPEAEAEDAGSDEEEDSEEEDNDPGLGTKDRPYTAKTLPKDRFVELKVDGKKTLIPLNELGDGYIRQETFHRRVNEVNQHAERALEYGKKAVEERQNLREEFATFITDPDQVFDFLMEHGEDVLKSVTIKYAHKVKEWQQPGKREAWELERLRAKTAAEREQVKRAKEDADRTAAEERAVAKFRDAFKPGYEAGLKEAGFPTATPELQDTIKLLVERRQRASKDPITSDEIKSIVVKAAKLVKAETVVDRKPPPAPSRPASKKPEAKKTLSKKDPDYWLQGLRLPK